MRTFIAIEISGEIKNSLAQIESHLTYAGADVKWAKPENVHLTLKFFGEIDEERAVEIAAVLDSVARTMKPFELNVKDIGSFPKVGHPRVIWVGLGKGAAETTALAGRIDEAFSTIGFAKETRPFSPHLTIGRVRSLLNNDKLEEKMVSVTTAIDMSAIPSHKIFSVILFRSTLTPHGSIYAKLHESNLAQ